MSVGRDAGPMARATSTQAQRIGDAAERLVAVGLEARGWTILARNLRLGRDELDLLAIDPGPPRSLVVVEVRRRGRRDFGLAEETLDHRKRAAMRRAVGALLAAGALPDGTPLPRLSLRVDLVAMDRGTDGEPSVRHHRGIRP
jgi:putative endonuclease